MNRSRAMWVWTGDGVQERAVCALSEAGSTASRFLQIVFEGFR